MPFHPRRLEESFRSLAIRPRHASASAPSAMPGTSRRTVASPRIAQRRVARAAKRSASDSAPRTPAATPRARVAGHVLDAAEVREQLRGGLGADSRHAGKVVDRVTDQRQEVRDLRGRDAEARAHAIGVERALAGEIAEHGAPSSRTSCARSLSALTTMTRSPPSSTRSAIVAITSSASKSPAPRAPARRARARPPRRARTAARDPPALRSRPAL